MGRQTVLDLVSLLPQETQTFQLILMLLSPWTPLHQLVLHQPDLVHSGLSSLYTKLQELGKKFATVSKLCIAKLAMLLISKLSVYLRHGCLTTLQILRFYHRRIHSTEKTCRGSHGGRGVMLAVSNIRIT